jgi:hypothetical protein
MYYFAPMKIKPMKNEEKEILQVYTLRVEEETLSELDRIAAQMKATKPRTLANMALKAGLRQYQKRYPKAKR